MTFPCAMDFMAWKAAAYSFHLLCLWVSLSLPSSCCARDVTSWVCVVALWAVAWLPSFLASFHMKTASHLTFYRAKEGRGGRLMLTTMSTLNNQAGTGCCRRWGRGENKTYKMTICHWGQLGVYLIFLWDLHWQGFLAWEKKPKNIQKYHTCVSRNIKL